MSTRCVIRVHFYGRTTHFYHHCDGYFSGVGLDLKDKLTNDDGSIVESPNEFMRRLMENPEDRYEITLYNHTDIEYLYDITFGPGCRKFIGYRVGDYDFKDYDDFASKSDMMIDILDITEDNQD